MTTTYTAHSVQITQVAATLEAGDRAAGLTRDLPILYADRAIALHAAVVTALGSQGLRCMHCNAVIVGDTCDHMPSCVTRTR